MAKTSREPSKKNRKPPARSPEAREQQLISLAIDCAEEQMINGTASAQVITHFLKLATAKTSLEEEKLRRENELLRAKAEHIESQKNIEELYQNAIDAMRAYSGQDNEEDEDD